MEVKDIIRNKRIELGLTMKELAEKIGVSEGTISRWESGEIANMRRDKIVLLANALLLSPAVIMGWEEPEIQGKDNKNTSLSSDNYYLNPETTEIAQDIFENKELRMLFSVGRDMDPEDLKALHNMALALKRKEGYDGDDPA